MARHDQYDDRERRRRRDHRGEGIFDRVRDWFSDRDDEQDYGQTSDYDRDWEYRQRYDRGDYRREPRGIHHPEYS